MLMPSKVKYRKQQRGRMRGKAYRGGTLAFGDTGLQVLEPGWVTARQIEAARIAMTRAVSAAEDSGPDLSGQPTQEAAETRMGKGRFLQGGCRLQPGRSVREEGVTSTAKRRSV